MFALVNCIREIPRAVPEILQTIVLTLKKWLRPLFICVTADLSSAIPWRSHFRVKFVDFELLSSSTQNKDGHFVSDWLPRQEYIP